MTLRDDQSEQFAQLLAKMDKRQVLMTKAYGCMLEIMDIARKLDSMENYEKYKATEEKRKATKARRKAEREAQNLDIKETIADALKPRYYDRDPT